MTNKPLVPRVKLPPWIVPDHVIAAEFVRTSGDTRCPYCGVELFRHPSHPQAEWLVISCEGKAYKL
jgi:hypothetical protein